MTPGRRFGQPVEQLPVRQRLRIIVRNVSRTGDGTLDNGGASGLGPIVLDPSGRHATIARWVA